MDTSSSIIVAKQSEQIVKKKKKKQKRLKRCHGDRKLRCLKKKWHNCGKTDEEIKQLIDEYHHVKNENNNQISQLATMMTNDNHTAKITTVSDDMMNGTMIKSKKRKRISTSTSQRSISQSVPKKKIKNKTLSSSTPLLPSNDIISTTTTSYRTPKYLKMLPNLLFQMLRIQLKHDLKKTKERKYIHRRLQLFDRQYRLECHRNLWQSYFTLGSAHRLWPNQVTKMTKTNEHELCQKFVTNRLTQLNQQYDQCTTELITQYSSCPSTLSSLQTLDQNLKDFVQIQEKYIINKMNAQLTRYKNMIHEQELFQTVLSANLTIDQKSIIAQLNELQQTQMNIYEELLKLETHLSIEYLPIQFHRLEDFIVSSDLDSHLIKNHLATEYKQQRYKIIQEAKRTWLNIYLHVYESQIQEHDFQYQQNLSQLKQNILNNTSVDGITFYDSFITYMNHRQNRIEHDIYGEKIPIYRRKLLRVRRQHLKSIKKIVSVLPKVILDILYNPFTARELAYLSRGPTYIRPNQSILRPYDQRMKNIKIEHDNIMNKLKSYMANLEGRPRLSRASPLYNIYSDRLKAYLTHCYMASIPFIDVLRTRRELRIVRSIRYKLRKYKLILRKTDKSGVLHIGQAIDYQRKAILYRQKTGAYEELPTNPLNDTFYKVIQLLNKLQTTQKIIPKQQDKMKPIRNKIELAYMYFLPKAHKIGIPLRPIINTIHAATTAISKFLDKLIRPLFDLFASTTTIIDGVDLLRKLQVYHQQGYFKLSTLFITFDITDLYTMLPQEESLKILAEFLHENHCEKINGISIETIIELARLVLQENVFVYEKKFYRQIIGGAMGSAFTLTLANIFMWKWQKETILSKIPSHECYGRYIDDIFFTWNGSEKTVKDILEAANRFHPNIKLTYTISKTISFLDLLLSNDNGILSTSVYHKPATEPIVVSFFSDHPRHVFRNIVQTTLMRAIRYSSTFEAFNLERRYIRLKLLYNGYPSTYINAQFHRFFAKYLSHSRSLLPIIYDEQQFFLLRQKLLAQPTYKQAEVTKRVAGVEIINHQLHGQNVQQTSTRPTTMVTIKRKDQKFNNTLFIHCKHEARLEGVKRHIHEIHDNIFKDTDFRDIRLVIGNRNNPDIDYELTGKRPSSFILKDQPKKKKGKQSEITTTA